MDKFALTKTKPPLLLLGILAIMMRRKNLIHPRQLVLILHTIMLETAAI